MSSIDRFADECEIFGMVFFLAQQCARMTDSVMRPLEITTKQWLLLAVLTRHFSGKAPMLSEVASVYGSSRQNVKMIAGQLESTGYLKLCTDATDRRILRLHLTEKVKKFDAPGELVRQKRLMGLLFSWASDSELKVLRQMTKRWAKAVWPETSEERVP